MVPSVICEASASLCLSGFPLASALNHTYTLDGSPYEGTIQGCDFDTISAFTYSTLFGQGNLGPFQLDNWSVNNMVFSGLFPNIPDLVDSMNLWDPLGNWQLDEGSLLIIGGFPGNTYSDMDVTVIAINSPSFIGYNFGLDAQGTEFVFGVGFHKVMSNNVSLESDTFYVSVNCASPETVFVQLQPGQVSEYRPDLSELSVPPEPPRRVLHRSPSILQCVAVHQYQQRLFLAAIPWNKLVQRIHISREYPAHLARRRHCGFRVTNCSRRSLVR